MFTVPAARLAVIYRVVILPLKKGFFSTRTYDVCQRPFEKKNNVCSSTFIINARLPTFITTTERVQRLKRADRGIFAPVRWQHRYLATNQIYDDTFECTDPRSVHHNRPFETETNLSGVETHTRAGSDKTSYLRLSRH